MTDPAWTPAYKEVTCKACGTTYTCTPTADYYNSTCATDGLCEPCLLKSAGLAHVPMVVIEVEEEGGA